MIPVAIVARRQLRGDATIQRVLDFRALEVERCARAVQDDENAVGRNSEPAECEQERSRRGNPEQRRLRDDDNADGPLEKGANRSGEGLRRVDDDHRVDRQEGSFAFDRRRIDHEAVFVGSGQFDELFPVRVRRRRRSGRPLVVQGLRDIEPDGMRAATGEVCVDQDAGRRRRDPVGQLEGQRRRADAAFGADDDVGALRDHCREPGATTWSP